MDEKKFITYVKDSYDDVLARPFFEKIIEWKNKSSPVYKELLRLLEYAEAGDFK